MAVIGISVEALDRTRTGLASAGRNLDRAEKKVSKFGKASAIAKGAIAGIGIAGVAAGAKLIGNFLKTGDALDKMNKRTGVGIETLQKWGFAAEQSGSSLETVQKGVLKMTRFLGDADEGLSTAVVAMDQLGLSTEDFQGLDPEQSFLKFSDAIAGIQDPMLKAAVAQDVFGRGGAELLPLLDEGASGINALGEQFAQTGNIMSEDAARAAAKFNDQMNVLKQKGMAAVQKALSALIPILLKAAEWIEDPMIPAIRDMTRWLAEKLGPTIETIGDISEKVFEAIADALRWLREAWASDWGNIRTILTATLDRIVVAVEAALDAVGDAFDFAVKAWEDILRPALEAYVRLVEFQFKMIRNAVKFAFDAVTVIVRNVVQVWNTIISPWLSGLVSSFRTAFGAAAAAVQPVIAAIDRIISLARSAIDLVRSIPTPSLPDIGGGILDKIPFFASGGVVTKPTLGVIGEAGPEAVVPLSQLRNTGGPMRVILEVRSDDSHITNVVQDAAERGKLTVLGA